MLFTISQYVLLAVALLCALGTILSRERRTPLFFSALVAGSGAAAAHYHVFWVLATTALILPWTLTMALRVLDGSWRSRAGITASTALLAWVALFPTYSDERWGKPFGGLEAEPKQAAVSAATAGDRGFREWILTNVPFRMVRGLDLKGGLRLVYNVDVEEAIKDKRDRYYDDLRGELAKAYGFAEGDDKPNLAQLEKLTGKVKLEKSKVRVGDFSLTFVDPADASKIDETFRSKFVRELTIAPSADRLVWKFAVRTDVESEIRTRAVQQAKDTVHRRVDAMGLKESSVTTRDEDIIIEIPGDDESAFAEIRQIIAQTARLEFKMVDDGIDFFAGMARNAKPEDLPKGLSFQIENAPYGPGKTVPIYFARIDRLQGEEMRDTLRRARDWASTLQVPDDREIAFEKLYNADEDTGEIKESGYRTFLLFGKAEVTGDMIRDARAQADQGQSLSQGWAVGLDFTPIGAESFAQVTGENIKKRFAILLDGQIESAPVIQSKISGGSAQITMGSGGTEAQARDAKKLELVLRSGALPAPISPSNEQRIGPTLGQDAIEQGAKAGLVAGLAVITFMVVSYARAGMIANIAVVFNLILQLAILAMFGAAMTLPGIAALALTMGIAVDANVLINERIRDELRHGKSARAAVDTGYDRAFSAILDGHVTGFISGLILAQYGTGPIKGFAIALMVGIAVSLFTGVVVTRLMFDVAVRGMRVQSLSLGRGLFPNGVNIDFMGKRKLFIGFSLALLVASTVAMVKPGPRLGTDFKGGTEVEVAFKRAVDGGQLRAAVTASGFDGPEVIGVEDKANPHRFMIRVHEVTALSEAQKEQIQKRLCFSPDGAVADAQCSPETRATELKFSPGGDKIFARFDVAPDLAHVREQFKGLTGVELREGQDSVALANRRDNRVEILLKSRGDQMMDGLKKQLGAEVVPDAPLRVEWIGPKAGAQLRDSAIKAIAIAIIFIMAYVAFRFDMRFAPGGIVALLHDVGIALGAMVLLNKEITLSTIAALLTIVGYSISDTVVVYDRIRENLAKHRDKSFPELINISVSEMFGRTIMTAATTFVSLIPFLIWGTQVIKDFAFTMAVGIVVGTYSSIFVAAPITEWVDRAFFGGKAARAKAVSKLRAAKRADAVV